MKVNIKVLPDDVTISIDTSNFKLLKDIEGYLNDQLNIFESYKFIYNTILCDNESSVQDLATTEDSTLYAIKSHSRPLKRKLPFSLSSILYSGVKPKNPCLVGAEGGFDPYMMWNVSSLSEVRKDLDCHVGVDPHVLEALTTEPTVAAAMASAGGAVRAMMTANPGARDFLETNTEASLSFSDCSQWRWVSDTLSQDTEFIETLLSEHPAGLEAVADSGRVASVRSMYEAASNSQTTNSKFLQNDVSERVMQLMSTAGLDAAATILQCCPYGSDLSGYEVSAIEGTLPASLSTLKAALAAHPDDPEHVAQYMRDHPLELDPETAELVCAATNRQPSHNDDHEQAGEGMSHLICELVAEQVLATQVDSLDERNKDSKPQDEYYSQLKVLQDMGYDSLNPRVSQVLRSEFGNVARAAMRLSTLGTA